jgi:transcriptional regulator with XRE-family HTH domain
MANMYWRELRVRRLRFRVPQREIAERLECSISWLKSLELGYSGPARDVWAERYQQALNDIISERRAERAAAKTG